MKKKLTLKEKMEIQKLRKLSWKDRREICRALTKEEREELKRLEEEQE